MKTGVPLALALKDARVCLDCDCLTDRPLCPWCDRADTVPIASWLRPIQESRSERGGRSGARATTPAGRYLLVVQPQQRKLYRVLREALDGTCVEVIYDRRVGQRRRVLTSPPAPERRRTDRRRSRAGAVIHEVPVAPEALALTLRPGAARPGVPIVDASPRRQPAPV